MPLPKRKLKCPFQKEKLKVNAEDIYSDTLYFKCSFYHLLQNVGLLSKNSPREFQKSST